MGEELKELGRDTILRHRGKTLGLVLGLLIGLSVLTFGFFQTVFILFCGGLGLAIGVKLDDKEDFWASLQKYLPEKFQRW